MRLNEWQREVERYLLGNQSTPDAALAASLLGSAALSAEQGLAIYHNAYRARLLEALQGDYAAIHAWLGDDDFERLGRDYLDAHPSAHFSLRWLGVNLAGFIEQHLVAEQAAPLAELARLEWAFTLAFDAHDAELLRAEHLAHLAAQDWPLLRVALQPSVQWLTLQHNSLELWRALKHEQAFPGSHALEHAETCLIWREQLVTRYRSLDPAQAQALQAMVCQGLNFAELCDSLQELGEQAPVQAARWLHQWLSDGLLVKAT